VGQVFPAGPSVDHLAVDHRVATALADVLDGAAGGRVDLEQLADGVVTHESAGGPEDFVQLAVVLVVFLEFLVT